MLKSKAFTNSEVKNELVSSIKKKIFYEYKFLDNIPTIYVAWS